MWGKRKKSWKKEKKWGRRSGVQEREEASRREKKEEEKMWGEEEKLKEEKCEGEEENVRGRKVERRRNVRREEAEMWVEVKFMFIFVFFNIYNFFLNYYI